MDKTDNLNLFLLLDGVKVYEILFFQFLYYLLDLDSFFSIDKWDVLDAY